MSDTKLTPDQVAEQYFKDMKKTRSKLRQHVAPNFSDLLATYGTAVYNTKDQRWQSPEELNSGEWFDAGTYTRGNQEVKPVFQSDLTITFEELCPEGTDIWIDEEAITEPETTHEWPEHAPLPSNLRSCKLRWEE